MLSLVRHTSAWTLSRHFPRGAVLEGIVSPVDSYGELRNSKFGTFRRAIPHATRRDIFPFSKLFNFGPKRQTTLPHQAKYLTMVHPKSSSTTPSNDATTSATSGSNDLNDMSLNNLLIHGFGIGGAAEQDDEPRPAASDDHDDSSSLLFPTILNRAPMTPDAQRTFLLQTIEDVLSLASDLTLAEPSQRLSSSAVRHPFNGALPRGRKRKDDGHSNSEDPRQ